MIKRRKKKKKKDVVIIHDKSSLLGHHKKEKDDLGQITTSSAEDIGKKNHQATEKAEYYKNRTGEDL